MIAELREKFDWVICDSPAGIERGATLAMRLRRCRHHRDQSRKSLRCAIPIASSGCSTPRPRRPSRASAWKSTCSSPAYDAARAARGEMLVDRRRARDPLDPAARHHSGERGSAEGVQHRLAGDAQQSRQRAGARLSGCGAPAARARRSPMLVPSERRGFSINCSDGGLHEPVQAVLRRERFRAGRAGATADPARARAQFAQRARLARHPARGNPRRASSKHVTLDPDKVQIKMDRGKTVSTLEVDIEVPNNYDKKAPGERRMAG